MPKSIDTLIPDIQALLTSSGALSQVNEFSSSLAKRLGNNVSEERSRPTLRLSNLGTPCRRKLWYSINSPEQGENFSAETRLKFLYGDILEETVLWLARESGHLVEGEQDEVDLFGVKGHIDAVIDGTLVDVKSASSYSFNRFVQHLIPDGDSFGYLGQLDAYQHSLSDVGRRRYSNFNTNYGAFLVVDKTLGKLTLDRHTKSVIDYEQLVKETKTTLSKSTPPARHYKDEEFGKSGNRKLGIACSYCPYKRTCWPGLRSFIYSGGPIFLSKVTREPDVKEVVYDRHA